MTGAIDQIGHVQAIGGVNEKIEGFFETCSDLGLTGTQGVIIPKTNAGDLMLSTEVVEACVAGKFAVYAVATINDAIEVLTGMPAGTRDENGEYPDGSVLRKAVEQALVYWTRTRQGPMADNESALKAEDSEEAPEQA